MYGTTPIYHITDITNLPRIIASGGLLSDRALASANGTVQHTEIGYGHIKSRRMFVYRVGCCEGAPFVGDFVPFYYCPRSVMLYTINAGNTGRPIGCQKDIVHLVTTVDMALQGASDWAVSDGNAGAGHTAFQRDLNAIGGLDWSAIRATSWSGRTHQKAAEFLVKDRVPWSAIREIACHNVQTAELVRPMLLGHSGPQPQVTTKPNWYY